MNGCAGKKNGFRETRSKTFAENSEDIFDPNRVLKNR